MLPPIFKEKEGVTMMDVPSNPQPQPNKLDKAMEMVVSDIGLALGIHLDASGRVKLAEALKNFLEVRQMQEEESDEEY